jgi:hypothetical protein
MATLSELARTVAEAEGMDPAAVALIARYVREAGFIQKKGRGPSAASMSVADAANLIIAVNASSSARDAPAVVPVYRDLVVHEFIDPKAHGTFGEALELVIQSAIEGKLPGIFLSKDVPGTVQDAFNQGKASISICFSRPTPSVFISISVEGPVLPGQSIGQLGGSIEALHLVFFPMSGRQKRTLRKKNVGDRTDDTKIGNLTIFNIAKKLRSNGRKAE